MRRCSAFLLGAVVLAALPAAGTEPAAEPARSPRALEVLGQADAAIKKVTAVRCDVAVRATGAAENFVSPAKGSSILVGWSRYNMPEKFRVELKTVDRRSGEPLELTGGGNGDTFFLIDHVAKRAYEDMDPAVMGSQAFTLRNFGMSEFVHDKPFDDELKAERLEYLGEEKIGDESCHVVVVHYGGNQKSTWYFSTRDLLPRRRVQHFAGPQGEGTVERTITRLESNPKLDDGLFRLKLPEGYRRIDDFAP